MNPTNISHEFRTPLHHIIGFLSLVLDAPDLSIHHHIQLQHVYDATMVLMEKMEMYMKQECTCKTTTGTLISQSSSSHPDEKSRSISISKTTPTSPLSSPLSTYRFASTSSPSKSTSSRTLSNTSASPSKIASTSHFSSPSPSDRTIVSAASNTSCGSKGPFISAPSIPTSASSPSISSPSPSPSKSLSKPISRASSAPPSSSSSSQRRRTARRSTMPHPRPRSAYPACTPSSSRRNSFFVEPIPTHLQPIRILAADDILGNCKLLAQFCLKLHIDIEFAANGQECYDKFIARQKHHDTSTSTSASTSTSTSTPITSTWNHESTNIGTTLKGAPTLIIMDLDMPIVSGVTSAQMIHEYEQQHHLIHTPIISLSAATSEDELVEGMDASLSKPISIATFRDTIVKWAQHRHNTQPQSNTVDASHHAQTSTSTSTSASTTPITIPSISSPKFPSISHCTSTSSYASSAPSTPTLSTCTLSPRSPALLSRCGSLPPLHITRHRRAVTTISPCARVRTLRSNISLRT